MSKNLLFLSIAGLAIGLSQIVNKKLALKGHRATTYTTVIMLVNAAMAIPLLFIEFYISASIFYWFLIVISVTAFAFSTYFMFKAYKETDLSLVSIIQRLNIVFVALIGITLLNEEYSLKSAIGLMLIFLGGLMIVYEKKKLVLSLGIIYSLLMALTGAIATVLDKVILNDFSPYTYVFVNNLLVGSVFSLRKGLLGDAKRLITQYPRQIFLSSFLATLSFVLVLIVLKDTDVSKTMPVYKGLAFITPVLLGITFLGEKQKFKQKVLGTVFGLIGIFLLH